VYGSPGMEGQGQGLELRLSSAFLLLRHQLHARAAMRAAQRSQYQRHRRSPARVGLVTRSVGRPDLDPRSRTVYSSWSL